jgi:xanthine/uracil permease
MKTALVAVLTIVVLLAMQGGSVRMPATKVSALKVRSSRLRVTFSLRTMLIAITLVAVGLGTVLWFSR